MLTNTIAQESAEPVANVRAPLVHRRALSRSECADVLREVGWGVLAVAERERDAAIPIGVPTAYAHDGERLYLAMSDGRKRRALEHNPHLCLTVADVRSLHEWRSVMVVGVPRWIAADGERARAAAAFTSHPRATGHQLSPGDVARLHDAQLMWLDVRELSGYAANDRADGHAPPRSRDLLGGPAVLRDDAPAAMDAIRRIIRALRDATSESERAFGVSAAQLFVLREIRKVGAPTIGELSRRTATAQSSVSEVVARLASRGFISRGRAADDRRRASITLTDAGRDVLSRAPESVPERMLAAFRLMSAERQRLLADGLAEWIESAGLARHAASMFFEPMLKEE